MKKTVFILSAVFALVACSKEKPVTQNDGPIDPSKVVFNFTVKHSDDTKGIKTGWVDGDVVYVFFSGNTSQCVKLTRNSESVGGWDFSDKDGGKTYAGLTLAPSGNVTAVYANAATPSIDGVITFGGAQPGYLLTATAGYTVTSTTDVTTLSAELIMRAPLNLIQVYVPGLSAPGSGNEYVLNMTNVKPFTVGAITPGDAVSAVSITYGTANFPLKGVNATIGSDSGYYFWGVLNETDASARTYNFQVVKQNAEKKYAISSKSKTGSTTLTGSKAIKLTSLKDYGNFVSLGYADGPLWATGNLKETSPFIADPLEAGDYYKWGYSTPYDVAGTTDAWKKYKADADFEDTAAAKNSNWCMPTRAQFNALITNTETVWKKGWTNIGTNKGGRLITSKVNGISLFFAAAGIYDNGSLRFAGNFGYYWSSTPNVSDSAYYLDFYSGSIITNGNHRYYGFSVRPVQN